MFFYECAVITHIGNRRKNNEDNFFIGNGEILLPEEQQTMAQDGTKVIRKHTSLDGAVNRLYAVSDGMGGYKNGEIASRMVAEALLEFSKQHMGKASRWRWAKYEFMQLFQDMVYQTNQDILNYSGNDMEVNGMGTTLSGVMLFSNEAVAFNIGDSATFLCEGGIAQKLTVDDNEAQRFSDVDSSLLEANGRRLTKYFGMSSACGVLTAGISPPIRLRTGQIYIIASDGLTGCASTEELAKAVSEGEAHPETIAERLVERELKKKNGGRDNITVVVLKVH